MSNIGLKALSILLACMGGFLLAANMVFIGTIFLMLAGFSGLLIKPKENY